MLICKRIGAQTFTYRNKKKQKKTKPNDRKIPPLTLKPNQQVISPVTIYTFPDSGFTKNNQENCVPPKIQLLSANSPILFSHYCVEIQVRCNVVIYSVFTLHFSATSLLDPLKCS